MDTITTEILLLAAPESMDYDKAMFYVDVLGDAEALRRYNMLSAQAEKAYWEVSARVTRIIRPDLVFAGDDDE